MLHKVFNQPFQWYRILLDENRLYNFPWVHHQFKFLCFKFVNLQTFLNRSHLPPLHQIPFHLLHKLNLFLSLTLSMFPIKSAYYNINFIIWQKPKQKWMNDIKGFAAFSRLTHFLILFSRLVTYAIFTPIDIHCSGKRVNWELYNFLLYHVTRSVISCSRGFFFVCLLIFRFRCGETLTLCMWLVFKCVKIGVGCKNETWKPVYYECV